MGAYKSLTVQDLIISPLEVNKSFTFSGNQLTGSTVNIDRFLGKNITGSLFDTQTDPTTGYINSGSYQRLIYNSAKHLYYSNFISSSTGDNGAVRELIPGADNVGDVYFGSPFTTNNENYLQSTFNINRYFPTSSNSIIGVISIPQELYGNYILPKSLNITAESGSLYDDGEGNVFLSLDNEYAGNIIYSHGLIILTKDNEEVTGGLYGVGTYGTSSYAGDVNPFIENFIASPNVVCSFSASTTIYETLYKCTVRPNEFNFTQNPTSISGSDTLYSYLTGSDFNPYITTVGLYNNNRELLAVGKLSQPLPVSDNTDTTIYIKIDK